MVAISKQLVLAALLFAPALAIPVSRVARSDGTENQATHLAGILIPRGASSITTPSDAFKNRSPATLIDDMETVGKFPKGMFAEWPEQMVREEYAKWAHGDQTWEDGYRTTYVPPVAGRTPTANSNVRHGPVPSQVPHLPLPLPNGASVLHSDYSFSPIDERVPVVWQGPAFLPNPAHSSTAASTHEEGMSSSGPSRRHHPSSIGYRPPSRRGRP